MKKTLHFFFLISISGFSQRAIDYSVDLIKPIPYQYNEENKKKIIGEWVKKDITLRDGSKIFLKSINETDLRYKFLQNDSVRITFNSKTFMNNYQVIGNKIKIGETDFELGNLTDSELILYELNSSEKSAIKVVMQPAEIHNLGFIPKFFVGKEEDTIYLAKRNYLEPLFLDNDQSPMEFISSEFDFSESKIGEFVVRFVITEKAEVRAVKVVSSTRERHNKTLIEAVKATKGKWQPAVWNGKPVNVEMEMVFDLGWSDKLYGKERQEEAEKTMLSQYYLDKGNEFYETKNYKSAQRNYTLSIRNNYQNVEAYYMRAATYITENKMKEACADLQVLKDLEQKRAENLYFRYCR